MQKRLPPLGTLLDNILNLAVNIFEEPHVKKKGNKTQQRPEYSDQMNPIVEKILTGLGGALLGTLLGQRGNKLARAGGGALLASLAFKAYNRYRNRKRKGEPIDAEYSYVEDEQSTDAQISEEERSRAIIMALVNIGKADGIFSEDDRANITAQVKNFSTDPNTMAWVREEIQKPLNMQELVDLATTEQLKTEIFLASLAAADRNNAAEMAYLERLRKALGIDHDLERSIEDELFGNLS